MMGRLELPRENDGKERERDADYLEERNQRGDDEHAVEERGLGGKHQDRGRSEEKTGSSSSGTKSGGARVPQTEGQNNQRGYDDDYFGRGQPNEIGIIHGFRNRMASTAGPMRSRSNFG